MTVRLTGSDLTIEAVEHVARGGERIELSNDAAERMRSARRVVDDALVEGRRVYGLTTGVGTLGSVDLAPHEREHHEALLIGNHRVARGPEATDDVVRATMLRLLNALARGTSLARPELAQRLVDALNGHQRFVVRTEGSVGAGDLAPMADLAAGLSTDFRFAPGEAIAVIGSNALSGGWGALACADVLALLETLHVTAAVDLEAWRANLSLLHPIVARSRPTPGVERVTQRLRDLLAGSDLWDEGQARHVQDPLTFRCLPQFHGAASDALAEVRRVVEAELNSGAGNPEVVVEEQRIVSTGTFEVAALATALDLARIALAPVLSAQAERTTKLLQPQSSGLPAGLVAEAGTTEDGLAEVGVAVQSFTAQARLLAAPVSFELVSTSQAAGIEDRTSMAPLAASRLAEMVRLGTSVAAFAAVVSCQAVDLRGTSGLGAGVARAHALVRERARLQSLGEPLPDVGPVEELVASRALGGLDATG